MISQNPKSPNGETNPNGSKNKIRECYQYKVRTTSYNSEDIYCHREPNSVNTRIDKEQKKNANSLKNKYTSSRSNSGNKVQASGQGRRYNASVSTQKRVEPNPCSQSVAPKENCRRKMICTTKNKTMESSDSSSYPKASTSNDRVTSIPRYKDNRNSRGNHGKGDQNKTQCKGSNVNLKEEKVSTAETQALQRCQPQKEEMVKRVYNLEIVTSPNRPGELLRLEGLMKEAMIVHNEIVRRINYRADANDIDIISLRDIIYFTQNGMIQHASIHYLTDLQISHILAEVEELHSKLANTHGLPKDKIRLNPLTEMNFLNFRRLGQTHWIDFKKKQVRLLGTPMSLKVKGLELFESMPSIRIGGMRLQRKGDGFVLSMQCFIPEKDMEEFNRKCIASIAKVVENEEEIVNVEFEESQTSYSPDYNLIEALREKFNRNKDLDKYDNLPRFLKEAAS